MKGVKGCVVPGELQALRPGSTLGLRREHVHPNSPQQGLPGLVCMSSPPDQLSLIAVRPGSEKHSSSLVKPDD